MIFLPFAGSAQERQDSLVVRVDSVTAQHSFSDMGGMVTVLPSAPCYMIPYTVTR